MSREWGRIGKWSVSLLASKLMKCCGNGSSSNLKASHFPFSQAKSWCCEGPWWASNSSSSSSTGSEPWSGYFSTNCQQLWRSLGRDRPGLDLCYLRSFQTSQVLGSSQSIRGPWLMKASQGEFKQTRAWPQYCEALSVELSYSKGE